MSRLSRNDSIAGPHDDWPSASYQCWVGRVGLLTREGELELARRRDRGWAVARSIALTGVDAEHSLDTLIADLRQMRDCERHRDPRARELEKLLHWRTVQRRCRRAVAARAWARARSAADQLRPAVDSIALGEQGWLHLVTKLAKTLEKGLAADGWNDAKVAQIEQWLGHPRSCWVELCEAIIEGERDAKRAVDELVEANLRLVMYVARRYRNQARLPILDLVQEGNLGLMRAAERFEPSRGLRFATFAIWWIRQGITRSISNHGRTVRIPVGALETLTKLNRIRREYDVQQSREPTAQELAKRVGLSVKRIEFLLTVDFEPTPLDVRVGEETCLFDVLEDTQAIDLIEHISSLERSSQARALLGQLTDQEQHVLRLRFGFEPSGEQRLEVIANELSLTSEDVRQLESQALEKLRRSLEG